MKTINKSLLTTAGILLGLLSCGEPELPTPNTFNSGATYKATFSFANATVDASSLDFYVNGIKLGTATPGGGSSLVTTVQIPTPGATGGVTANTSIRAKATSGSIGGRIGSNDLIYRSTNNGTNVFAAVNNANYTVIAVDSINRPVPLRLNRQTATIAFADVTYWNPNVQNDDDTFGKMISASRRDSLNPANCVTKNCTTCTGCVNWDTTGYYLDNTKVQNPSTAIEYANLVTVGLVPLGLTDVGGVRFYVTTDAPLTFTAGNVATNAGIRFVNAVANANGISAAANANGTAGGPPIHARLRPAAGANISLATGTSSVVSAAGGFSPNAGSRTAGNLAFTSQAIATAGAPNSYTLEVATDAGYTNILYSAAVSFAPGRNYTVFVRGVAGATGSKAITHGVITH